MKHGKGVMSEGMSCTSPGAEVEGESEGGQVSCLKGAGLGDPGRLKVWVETLRKRKWMWRRSGGASSQMDRCNSGEQEHSVEKKISLHVSA